MKNLLYDPGTDHLTIVDYENLDTQIFTHDLGRYFFGYVGIPFDFTKLPDEDKLKQFVRFYLEERCKLLEKPISEITDEVVAKNFYWAKLGYTFVVFLFGISCFWFHLNFDYSETPLPAGTNTFRELCLPCLQEYYRMKENLNKAEFKMYHK